MHEISLCRSLLQVIERQSEQQHFRRVKTVRLEVGALAGVEPAALEFSFAAVMKQTLAEGARLEIIRVPAQGWCEQCGRSIVIEQRIDSCPVCHAFPLGITAGDELNLKELEVE
jgi:hydrogenase nickel incorporation protein HypA/HybF